MPKEAKIEDNVKAGDNVELIEVDGVYIVRRIDKKTVLTGPHFVDKK